MIEFINILQETPYLLFKEKYDEALNANQKNIEAISIASFNKKINEVDSRYVNLKFIDKDRFIFFSNYNSPKSLAFKTHNQITGLFYWSSTNVQIRIKANIEKTGTKYNQDYFKKRLPAKNALAIASFQSKKISSYEEVIKNYNETYKESNLSICPEYWGGFSFIPYYFEFWEGNTSRLNKRDVYKIQDDEWNHTIIEP